MESYWTRTKIRLSYLRRSMNSFGYELFNSSEQILSISVLRMFWVDVFLVDAWTLKILNKHFYRWIAKKIRYESTNGLKSVHPDMM